MVLSITPERPDTETARLLIAELELALESAQYPQESRHGYPVDKLLREGVHFFIMREGAEPAGCGGIQYYSDFGELKRMYVRPAFRGRGLGRAMLHHLERHAGERGCFVLRLETGIYQSEAIALYERGGFVRVPAFPPYKVDPMSLFYEKRLSGRPDAPHSP